MLKQNHLNKLKEEISKLKTGGNVNVMLEKRNLDFMAQQMGVEIDWNNFKVIEP